MSDKFVIGFCDDCIGVLKEYDAEIKKNLLESEYTDFYKYDTKGIGVYSITEPILKFLIFGKLCRKYQIWPEQSASYRGRKILDIALYSKRVKDIDGDVNPDIAIEMKWGGFRKDGTFYQWSVESCIADLYKLRKESRVENKYFMQFIICNADTKWEHKALKAQMMDYIDRRKLKENEIKFIYSTSFDTCGSTSDERRSFYILLWKVAN